MKRSSLRNFGQHFYTQVGAQHEETRAPSLCRRASLCHPDTGAQAGSLPPALAPTPTRPMAPYPGNRGVHETQETKKF